MNYYFLVSSLPRLAIGEHPSLSFESFVALCREHLAPSDMSALAAIADNNIDALEHGFLKAWRKKDTLIRNASVKARATRLGRAADDYAREAQDCDLGIEKGVADAFNKPNPLEKELSIDKLRWKQIEETEGFNPFSGSAVLGYALRLRITERWARLNREKAKSISNEIINKNPEEEEPRGSIQEKRSNE